MQRRLRRSQAQEGPSSRRPRLRWAAVALLAAPLLLAAGVLAGTAEDPELRDPQGDVSVERGPAVVPGVNDESFDDVDILSAWFRQDAVGGDVVLHVQLAAAARDGLEAEASFLVRSAQDQAGRAFSATAFEADGALLRFRIPPAQAGAAEGDELAELRLVTRRMDDGAAATPVPLPSPLPDDDETGSDEAGPGLSFRLLASPAVPGIRLTLAGGTVEGPGLAHQFSGATTRLPPQATAVVLQLRVTNTGSQADDYTLEAVAPPQVGLPPMEEALARIGAGETLERTLRLEVAGLQEAADVVVHARSGLGASDSLRLRLEPEPVAPVPPEAPREPVPSRVAFLTPLAGSLRLDDALGRFAELFLLGLLVLLGILALYVLLHAGARPVPAGAAPAPAGPPPVAPSPRTLDLGGGPLGPVSGGRLAKHGEVEIEVNTTARAPAWPRPAEPAPAPAAQARPDVAPAAPATPRRLPPTGPGAGLAGAAAVPAAEPLRPAAPAQAVEEAVPRPPPGQRLPP
ncbi:MAG TPA: hypothetical protein VFH47_09300, partial [Candidatus Thermoplasmatota archaeon]|nr:hypothetical protein [Candidatus Thermoplasmatota archaeon]